MLKRNEGARDRILRFALGVVFLPAALFLLGVQGNPIGLVVAFIGVIGLVSAITGFCPTYTLFGFSTLESEKKQNIASTHV